MRTGTWTTASRGMDPGSPGAMMRTMSPLVLFFFFEPGPSPLFASIHWETLPVHVDGGRLHPPREKVTTAPGDMNTVHESLHRGPYRTAVIIHGNHD
ncbi:hypothetical protein CCHR01_19614 [Colletotrichum chrysophilum]|uniref:Uncharacterized protein n=1 Tax=Colletotrichum chrysophilum TaxID=1836956 RepID=A0AAD8ZY42_9PEZI|nr:hypothetical protein CCHR01_19614 [Colletotrichum chrysophilum]